MEDKILQELADLKQLTLLTAKRVLTLDDVSLLTGISKSALYKMTSRREIPFFRRGKFCYFERAELEAWMMENRIATRDEIESEALNYCQRNRKGGQQ